MPFTRPLKESIFLRSKRTGLPSNLCFRVCLSSTSDKSSELRAFKRNQRIWRGICWNKIMSPPIKVNHCSSITNPIVYTGSIFTTAFRNLSPKNVRKSCVLCPTSERPKQHRPFSIRSEFYIFQTLTSFVTRTHVSLHLAREQVTL